MPCDSSYMRANDYEVRLSQVACLLDELNGKVGIDKSDWGGYHPKVYNRRADGDALVSELYNIAQDAVAELLEEEGFHI